MRRDARVDENQAEIVEGLRKAGATVEHLHAVGLGCPDLLVGYRGGNGLMELKLAKSKLTPRQRRWHDDWRGQVAVVRTVEEALAALSLIPWVGGQCLQLRGQE